MNNIISENEMERILDYNGFDITDGEGCTDSTKVIDYAFELGYDANMDEKTGIIVFTKSI